MAVLCRAGLKELGSRVVTAELGEGVGRELGEVRDGSRRNSQCSRAQEGDPWLTTVNWIFLHY